MVLWSFLMQLTLIIILVKYTIWGKYIGQSKGFEIYTPSVEVFVTRFICTILMHLKLINEIKHGKNMLIYASYHPQKFVNYKVAVLVALI